MRKTMWMGLAVLLGCGGHKAKAPDLVPTPVKVVEVPKLTVVAPSAPPPAVDGRLPRTVTPLGYDLALDVDPNQEGFAGTATIAVRLSEEMSAIVMHGRAMTIKGVSAEVAGKVIAGKGMLRMAAGGKDDPEELVLLFDGPLPKGDAKLSIVYSAPYDKQLRGLYRVKEGEAWYAFTQFEPTDARRAFPCFDEPGWKTPFRLTIDTPKGLTAIANSPEADVSDLPDGKVRHHFAETLPLPTYLAAWGVGTFDFYPDAKANLRVVTTKGRAAFGQEAATAGTAFVKALGEYFDYPYPFGKLDLVAVPEFAAGAMENPGMITFRDEVLLLDSKTASSNARRRMAETLAHELSHQWFGDLVTMVWWNDLWLNEGFATWMEAKIVDQWKPAFGAKIEALSSKGWVMGEDALDSARAVRQPVSSTSEALEAFDGITYEKGAAILNMLESYMGADRFRTGIRAYIKAHQRGSATADDLFVELDKASPDKPVSQLAAGFLNQAGLPIIQLDEPACADKAAPTVASVTLHQTRYRPLRSAESNADAMPKNGALALGWQVPICLLYSTGKGKTATACTLLTENQATVALPGAPCKGGWIYPDAAEAGYYRFRVTDSGFTALADAAAKKQLGREQRLGLLTDAWALVGSGHLGADVFLATVARFTAEDDRYVVDAIDDALRSADHTLIEQDARPAFQAYVAKLIGPLGKKLGWGIGKQDDEDRRLLRQTVFQLLADLASDTDTLRKASTLADAWLKAPDAVNPDQVRFVALGSRLAGQARFDALRAAVKTATTPERRIVALSALGNFEAPALQGKALELMMTDDIRAQDLFYIVRPMMRREALRGVLWTWMKANWDPLMKKVAGFAGPRVVAIAGSFCTHPERDDAAAFLSEHVKKIEGADRALKENLEAADLCIDQRTREAPRVKAFFAKK